MLCSSFRKVREQLLAHGELFVGTAWYPKVKPHQWFEAVRIRREDALESLDAIATNLVGTQQDRWVLPRVF